MIPRLEFEKRSFSFRGDDKVSGLIGKALDLQLVKGRLKVQIIFLLSQI